MRFSALIAAGLLATLACSSKSTTQKTPSSGGAAGAAAAGGGSATGGSAATGGGSSGAPSGGGSSATGGTAGSSGSGGSAGTPTGGAGGSSGSGGSAGAPVEVCDDGVDNDKNGDTDCADAACTTHECLAPVPANWKGPVHLFVGPGPTPPSCAGTIALEGAEGTLSAAPVTCSPCSCGSPTGAGTCAPIEPVTFFQTAGCGQPSAATSNPVTINSCLAPPKVGFPTLVNPKSAQFLGVKASGFSCTASGGGLDQVPTPSFENEARACNMPAGAGCSGGDICVAKSKTPFASRSCIYKDGDDTCPVSGMARTVVYTSFVDARDCTPCGCNAPGGCSGTMEMYDTVSCGGTMTSKPLPANGGCIGQTAAIASYKLVNLTPSGCGKVGGQPHGTITPTGPRTVCCWT